MAGIKMNLKEQFIQASIKMNLKEQFIQASIKELRNKIVRINKRIGKEEQTRKKWELRLEYKLRELEK